MRVPAETLRAVAEKAALLNGGASLGEGAAPLAEIAVQRALAYCGREDVPEGMEQAVGALLLALWSRLPRSGGSGGEDAGETVQSLPAMDWETLLASGAVKTVQRGDTSITFQSSGGTSVSGALSGAGPSEEAALEALKPWRRLGRLRREEGPGDGA